jgi:dipeptidyl aminopeptidase/acylaminoacyl peptidase
VQGGSPTTTPTSRIALEDIARLPSHWQVTASPDGRFLAYYSERTGRFELYTLDLESRIERRHTDGDAPSALRTGFFFTPDGRSILFTKDQGGNEKANLYRLDLDTDRVTQLNDDPESQEYAGPVSPDGREALILSNRAAPMNLFAFDLEARTFRPLTHSETPVWNPHWSPDGRRVAYSSDTIADADVYVVERDGSGARRVFRGGEPSMDAVADWHPDGGILAVTSDAQGLDRIALVDVESGEVRWLGDGRSAETALRFSRDGLLLLALRSQDATLMPVVYTLQSGEGQALPLPPGVAASADFVLDDTCVAIAYHTTCERTTVSLHRLADGTAETVLEAEYGRVPRAALAEGRSLRYPSSGGVEVPAILYVPPGAAAGDRLPALVHVHGGPTGQFMRGFDAFAQFLQGQGYVVLEPNVRGSTGYGTAWRDACLGDWGGKDLEDVAAAAAYLRSLPEVDPERVGVLGTSYGGYMSYMATARTPDLFRVAVPMYGITDLPGMEEETSPFLRYYLHQQMGDPAEHADLWRERSAITYADQVRAPLLILHGLSDPRCPAGQARRFREALLRAGRREGADGDFEYHELAEGHGAGGNLDAKIRDFGLVADFLARRL